MTTDHLSYSALSSYISCPRKFWLGRVVKAEGTPAWYFAVGTAVHSYIEAHLRGELDLNDTVDETVEQLFMAEVERLMLIEPDTHKWAHGGSKEEPVIEERALILAQRCAENALMFLSDIDVWEVELDVSGNLPYCPLPVHGYADVIGEHKKYGPVIIDWKTGKSKPKETLQLETYNCLRRVMDRKEWRGLKFKGMWAMLNPGASQARPVELIHSPRTLGMIYRPVAMSIQKGVFPALIQYNCRFCEQALNCRAKSGATQRTNYYDRMW